ncbi:helix-turn-helix domain-containing protein [Ornithinimicrobium sp. INDO-MA30-4]|uniref:helix-turn-helix domain-containing protein n=1 Tax=Ornithinimicrobium sp. INDO-MA30-4 TaxID=2908651 RepID=UPI0037CBAC24
MTNPPEPISTSQPWPIRKAAGLTIEAAAAELHCSMATLSHTEGGHSANRDKITEYLDFLTRHQTTLAQYRSIAEL